MADAFARLRLTGELTLQVRGELLALTAIEFEEERDLARLTLRAPMRELRKLDALGPGMARMLASWRGEPGDRSALAKFLATKELRADLASARPDADPQEWVRDAAWAAQAFDLERYVPEAVGIVTYEGGDPPRA